MINEDRKKRGSVGKMTQGTEKQTSSRSPFARKSRTDIVVLYFKASAMNSAPFAPIWINIVLQREDMHYKQFTGTHGEKLPGTNQV